MIPPYRAQFTDPERAEILAATEQILRSGRLTLGPYTERFEARMAELAGCRHAVAVNSGTSALEAVFRALEVRGRRVLVPTNTNFATGAAAVYAGAKVELYDAGLYPSLGDLAPRITPQLGAVVIVHIGGYPSPDLPRIATLCQAAGVPLVEDAAHAHGAALAGTPAGAFGTAAAFSFFPTKVVTTGEGGMVTTSDDTLAAQVRRLRDQGKTPDGRLHDLWGNSWRLTEIGAAMGLAQLGRLTHDTATRQAIIAHYAQRLADIDQISVTTPAPAATPSGYKCVALLAPAIDRARLKAALHARRVQLSGEVYQIPLHHQPTLASVTTTTTDPAAYPEAEDFCARHVCLPLWPSISPDVVQKVGDTLAAQLQPA